MIMHYQCVKLPFISTLFYVQIWDEQMSRKVILNAFMLEDQPFLENIS